MVDFSSNLASLLRNASVSDLHEAARRLANGAAVVPAPAPAPVPVSTLDPAKVPGANFDLKLWKITLPVDSSGGKTGVAVEIKPVGLTVRPPYFVTGVDGAMVFEAPVDGATTSGSKYSRSELRELKPDATEAGWLVETGGTLRAVCSVDEVPVKAENAPGRVIVGQIHGPDDELCRLYYDAGKIYFYDDKAGSSKIETQFILKDESGATSNIPLGAKFEYSIIVTKQNLTVSVVYGSKTYKAIDPISTFWPGKANYFKAGCYLGVGKSGSGVGTIGTGKGRVSFYRLDAPSHP